MANSELKLYYFNSKARAEVSRLILAFAGKMYEDIRISMEDWPNYKPLMPLGKVPALEVDGVKFPQGLAIHYYLAREFGLYPSDHKDQFVIDIVMQSVEELFNVAGRINFTPEGDEKEAKMKEARETQIPPLLTYLEQVLASNGTGYFVGNSLTLADLTAFDVQTGFLSHFIDAGDKYPLLKKNMAIVLANGRLFHFSESDVKALSTNVLKYALGFERHFDLDDLRDLMGCVALDAITVMMENQVVEALIDHDYKIL